MNMLEITSSIDKKRFFLDKKMDTFDIVLFFCYFANVIWLLPKANIRINKLLQAIEKNLDQFRISTFPNSAIPTGRLVGINGIVCFCGLVLERESHLYGCGFSGFLVDQ